MSSPGRQPSSHRARIWLLLAAAVVIAAVATSAPALAQDPYNEPAPPEVGGVRFAEPEKPDAILGERIEEPDVPGDKVLPSAPGGLPITGRDLILLLIGAGAAIAAGTLIVRRTRRSRHGG